MELSFWEVDSYFRHVDLAIIGGGIVGMNAALEARQLHPEMNIIILERGALPSGASTKNAGFACFGSVSELKMDIAQTGFDNVVRLAEKRYRGLQALREMLGDSTIGLHEKGGMELFMSSEQSLFEECVALLPELNRAFSDVIGPDCYHVTDGKIAEYGFGSVSHIITNQYEAQIDTGKMMRVLTSLCIKEDIAVLTGMNVEHIRWDDHGVDLMVNNLLLRVGRVIVATNGFAAELIQVPVQPARAQVLITKPIDNLRLEGTFHYDRGYNYFRNVGKRVLLGGGRNLDPVGETTTALSVTADIQRHLEQLLRDVILPGTPFQIDMRWSGIMGVGSEKMPIIKALHPRVVCAVRMGGMGVALGTLAGKEAAALL
jgi:hypothetical protein